MKKLIIIISSLLILTSASVKHQNKIYFVSYGTQINNEYKHLVLDENGNGYEILSNDDITGQWITGDSIKLIWSKDEFIYDYEIME